MFAHALPDQPGADLGERGEDEQQDRRAVSMRRYRRCGRRRRRGPLGAGRSEQPSAEAIASQIGRVRGSGFREEAPGIRRRSWTRFASPAAGASP